MLFSIEESTLPYQYDDTIHIKTLFYMLISVHLQIIFCPLTF